MSWNDRITEAAYVTPSGKRFTWVYENVGVDFEKKTTAFEFTEANKTFVQDLGRTGNRFPLRIFFSGNDYDVEAAEFSKGLSETGIGSLEHPLYGTFDVVPFGTIRRRDDLKTAANQAVFEVDFWETTRLLFPTAGKSPADDAKEAITDSMESNADNLEKKTKTDTKIEETSLQQKFQEGLGKVQKGLKKAAEFQADVEQRFNAVFDSINAAIDTLIGDPLSLAFQAQILVGLPARSGALIGDRLKAYSNLLTSIVDQIPFVPQLGNESYNSFLSDELFASATLLGASTAAINTTYDTRSEALATADALLLALDDYNAWRDTNFASLGEVDTGETYKDVIRSVYSTAGFLVEISFTLRQERRLTLDRARTPVDLTAELYGEFGVADSMLDFLINSNELVGLDIFEIPQGREVVYYR